MPRGLKTAMFKPALGYFGSVVATGNCIQTAPPTSVGASDRRALRVLTWPPRSIRPKQATPRAELPSACRTSARWALRLACVCRWDRRAQRAGAQGPPIQEN
jgi:hypothetical protein